MIQAIIIDDEANGRETLQALVEKFCPEVTIVATADSVVEGIKAIHKCNPNLVFLDIEMPHASGFDLLEMVGTINFEVIFTTAHDQYALKAIKFSALDYLLKPVDIDELRMAVAKLSEKITSPALNKMNIEMLLSNLKTRAGSEKLAIPTSEGLHFIDLATIVRCEADTNYTRIHLDSGESVVVARTLREYEEILSDMNFFRIHNSNLINLNHIKKYTRGDGGFVTLTDGAVIEVSRRKKNEFLKRFPSGI